MPNDLLNAKDAAQLLGVKAQTLYAYVSRGKLTAVHARGARVARYWRSEVENLQRRGRARTADVVKSALSYGAPVLDSAITHLDVQRGPLYRGHAAVDLCAANTRFEDVAALLIVGILPKESGATWLANDAPRVVRDHGGPAALLVQHLAARPVADRLVRPDAGEWEAYRQIVAGLVNVLQGARPPRHPAPLVAQRLLRALGGRGALGVEVLNAALVLLADHELNPSTFAARIAASTGTDLAGCLVVATEVLAGPRHGGACDRIEDVLAEIDAQPQRGRAAHKLVAARLGRSERVPGFFRELYPRGDPRARALLAMLDPRHPQLVAVHALVEAYGNIAQDRAGPSVDLALVAATRALGLQPGSALALFSLARSAGWTAHVLEQRRTGTLIRPRAGATL